MAAKKAKAKGKRYTEEEKAAILSFVESEGRGGATRAAKKFGVSPLTISSWKNAGKSRKAAPNLQEEVIRSLAGKGFKFVRLANTLTGEIIEEKSDAKIEKLGLDFGSLPAKVGSKAYVSKNSTQFLVTMTLERLLELTGTKP